MIPGRRLHNKLFSMHAFMTSEVSGIFFPCYRSLNGLKDGGARDSTTSNNEVAETEQADSSITAATTTSRPAYSDQGQGQVVNAMAVPPTPSTTVPNPSEPLTQEQLRKALLNQLEYYFSP